MKIGCISDIHGKIDGLVVEPCDILIIAGDICPHFGPVGKSDDIFGQMKWLLGPFKEWLDSIPVKEVVAVCGNHDFIFEKKPELVPKLRWHYLQDDVKVVNGVKFYGSPWQLYYHHWAFNAPDGLEGEEFLERKYSYIPEDVDIVVTHGPPMLGLLDVTERNRSGSTALAGRLTEIKPLLSVSGHLHSGYGTYEIAENSIASNAAVLDEEYELVRPPLYFEVDIENRKIREIK